MTTETETLTDVLAEMRDYFDDEREMFDTFSSRIQTAHAREVGDIQNDLATHEQALSNEVAEVDKLTAEVTLLKQANIAYSSENANLRGRAMAAEKDAARYRWLRDIGGMSTIMFTLAHRREADEWDEEIDAAMGEPVREVLR